MLIGAELLKVFAAAVQTGATLVLPLPVMLLVTVSVAVMVWGPVVARVTVKIPVPLARVELGGRVAEPSDDVILTVPL